MKDETPRSLEETLDAIKLEKEMFDEVHAVLAMSEGELDKQLEDAGVDTEGLDARMAAREAEIRKELDAPRARKSRPLLVALAACWTLVTAGATHVVDVLSTAPVTASPSPTTSLPTTASPVDQAEALRREAFEACGKTQWRACRDELDQAARLDPAGDKKDDVERARAFATKQLE